MTGSRGAAVRGLVLSCHPLPTIGVTAIGLGLGVLAGLPLGRLLLLVVAVLAGQLSIGWSNDRLDAARDRAVGRADKPVAGGRVSERTVGLAAGAALLVAVVTAALLGPAVGPLLAVVVCGWAYNLGLKATPLSLLPYAIAFGLLPAAATLAAQPPFWPAWWAITAGALLGSAAHLANVLPDLRDDAATGVRGLPHRLGLRRTAIGVPVLLAVAAAVVWLGGGFALSRGWPAWLLGSVLLIVVLIAALRRPEGRVLFLGTLTMAGLVLLGFALAGGRLG